MTSSLTLLVMVFLLLAKQAHLKPLIMVTSLPTPTGAEGCEYNGAMYPPGLIYEDKCHGADCVEMNGQYAVQVWDKWCFFTITTISGSPTTYPGSPTTYPGSPTTYPGSPTTYPGSPTTYPSLPMTYSGSGTTYPSLPTTYPGSPTTYPVFPGLPSGLPNTYPSFSGASGGPPTAFPSHPPITIF